MRKFLLPNKESIEYSLKWNHDLRKHDPNTLFKKHFWEIPAVQWLGLGVHCQEPGFNPGWGTFKIPQAAWPKTNKNVNAITPKKLTIP